MCDKCNFTDNEGNCINPKADRYRRPCPVIYGADVNDCPTVSIKKTCSTCSVKTECSDVEK
jgi:hypothetical protein